MIKETKTPRKAVQLSVTTNSYDTTQIIVLCDDGSIWKSGHNQQWLRMPDIPQD